MTSSSSPTRRRADNASDIETLALVAARSADARKAETVTVLEVGPILSVTDYFVIATASNTRLVAAIVDSVEEAVKRAGGPGPTSTEGLNEASWVLLDYGGFVVHVFTNETYAFYDLERLFADAKRISWQEDSSSATSDEQAAASLAGD